MSMTKEQIEERLQNIDRAISIMEMRKANYISTNGYIPERIVDELNNLYYQKEEIIKMRRSLDMVKL